MKRSFIREILEHTTNQTISFAGGLPNESLFPYQALRESGYRALSEPASLQYTTSQGYQPLREKIAEQYAKQGFPTKSEEIMITSGSQQALDIITRFYHSHEITIEAPSYLGAMNVFSMNKLKQSSVKLEYDGIDIEGFAQNIQQSKLAYLIPDFQNPTGLTYSEEKRRLVADHIEDVNGVLIEDSPYSQLFFERSYPSISSMVPKHSFHLGSFSKVLAPALRIGWIRASEALLKPLIPYKEAMDLHTNSIAQRIIDDYLSDIENYQTHLETIRSSYGEKMEFFAKALDEFLPMFEYRKPKGGMFIYGSLDGISTSNLVQKCLQKNVVFVPGREFYLNGSIDNEIRFNFTNSTKNEIVKGLRLVNSTIHK
ncbi:PLP-dependent aminotransferase family protein [Sulfurovum sp. AR]|uniref:aminotransferase-like domain-containing protein n=1 Tax=Sulfurovum sp. AR TaxID=1165841 RepID=UPI00025C47FA|nr:PLP-dependent aminotransferase family protein [Sulfurovum sp. AR]EIF51630.1 aminotransferase, classes I and II [Sulfurovum sp. AR]